MFLNIKWKKTKLKTKLKVPRNSHSQIIFFFSVIGGMRITAKHRVMRVSMGLTDRRKTAKNLADSRKN